MDSFDEKDPLWNTLGKARPIKVSTGFARRVRRAATRQESSEPFSLSQLLRWVFPIGSAAAVLALWIFISQPDTASLAALGDDASFDGEAAITSLVAYDDGSVWPEIVFY